MERVLHHVGLKANKSKGDLLAQKEFPTDSNAYELLDDCGRGVSATVHRARVKETGEIVAVKKLNLESINCNLDEIIHEAQTMKQYNHPNVLPLHCSFVQNEDLWMVMPYISGGSILNIMKYACPDGLEEMTIATIMKEVLKGLDYVHKHGGIHRDIKAGNILLDDDGTVKIADFGVAATTERGGSWNSSAAQRHTFVGTPCWMAPEVMEQTQGYDSSADIWSFGITLLEMAHGHAPFAKFPPMKVLLMTLQNPPPTLDDVGKKHYSKHMKDVVSKCLQKDAKMRPRAEQLLEHKFFRQAKDEDYLRRCLLAGLPPLIDRVRLIRQGKAATNAEDNDRRAEKSAEEYARGVSSWNFDMDRLKAEAMHEDDDDARAASNPLRPHAAMRPMPPVLESEPSIQAPAVSAHEASTAPNLDKPSTSMPRPPTRTGTCPSDFQTMLNELNEETQPAGPAPQQPAPQPAALQPSAPQLSRQSTGASAAAANGKLTTAFGHFEGSPAGPRELASVPSNLGRTSMHLQTDPSAGDLPLPPLETSSSANLVPSTTPKVVKKPNRFKVYEEGDVVPPLSPVTSEKASVPQAAPSVLQASLDNGLPLERPNFERVSASMDFRSSEDTGPRLTENERTGSEKGDDEGNPGKRKGRFIIKEEDLKNSMRLSGIDVPKPLRPSDSRSSLVASPMGSAASGPSLTAAGTAGQQSMLPMLSELLEHSNQQTRALQRAFAVLETYEKTGKIAWPPGMSKSSSTGRLPSILDWRETLLSEVDTLRDRVVELERKVRDLSEENSRLRVAASGGQVASYPVGQ